MMFGIGVQERKIGRVNVTIYGNAATIGAEVPEQVIHEDYSDRSATIYTNPADLLKYKGVLPSFSMIRFAKVKNFIDGVYAAVEETVAKKGERISILDFLNGLERKLENNDAGRIISTALLLGQGENTSEDSGLRGSIMLANSDPQIKLPQGFYDWTQELRNFYKQLKTLAARPGTFFGRTDEEFDRELMREIHSAIEGDSLLQENYNKITGLYSRMTNELNIGDGYGLIPPARLPDQEFFIRKSMETQSDIPNGLGLALVEAIKNREVDFSLNENSGLYIWQINEILPLVLRDSLEFKRYLVGDRYGKKMESEFISQWVATRHTHMGHTDFRQMLFGCSSAPEPDPIDIAPNLIVEPLVTGYEKMTASLKFLENVLIDNFGDEFLEKRRLLHDGSRQDKNIGEEFGYMGSLLNGFAVVSRDSLHLSYKNNENLDVARKTALSWVKNAKNDPDMNRNVAIFVPIIRETSGERQIAYIDFGFKTTDLTVGYRDKPEISVSPSCRYNFENADYDLPGVVHREVRIPADKLINDRMLRELLPGGSFSERDLDNIVKKIEAG
ncbi:MAG: hypothetical protein AABY22_32270 [Nanoarchaeota archaeon]